MQWRQIDLANGAFGQGVAVTPMQLAQSYAAMVNGGVLVRPHVVKQVGPRRRGARSRGRVMSPKLSGTLIKLMRNVIDTVDFYRDRTHIPGFDVGGKTGTAQIWDAEKEGLEGQQVQLLVHRLHRAREGPPRPRRRGADRGGDTDRHPRRPARDAGHVVRAVPADRARRDQHPRPRPRASGPRR